MTQNVKEIAAQPNYPVIMRSEELERDLLVNGYLVIRNFLSQDTVDRLWEYNEANQPPHANDGSIRNTVWKTNDENYKRATVKLLEDTYLPACEAYFKDFRLYGGAFIIKEPGPKAVSMPHFDHAIVDEDKFRAFSIWVPLMEVNSANGILQVAPKSHIFKNIFRGPNIPDPAMPLREWLWKQSIETPLNPGDALVYDHRLVHGSKENRTSSDRIVASCTLTSASAPLSLYYLNDARDSIDMFQVEQDHFLKGDPSKYPHHLKRLKTWPYDPTGLKPQRMPFLNHHRPNIFERLVSRMRR